MKSTNFLRRKRFLCSFVALLCLGVMCAPAAAAAKAPPMLTKADHADIASFVLTKNVLQRLQAVITEGRKSRVKRVRVNAGSARSLAGIAEHMTASNPSITALLAKHGFTPRGFLVADLAVVVTVKSVREVLAAPAANSGKTAKAEKPAAHAKWWVGSVNPVNVDFYKTHKAAMDKIAKESSAPLN